jgi:hypothetical protein
MVGVVSVRIRARVGKGRLRRAGVAATLLAAWFLSDSFQPAADASAGEPGSTERSIALNGSATADACAPSQVVKDVDLVVPRTEGATDLLATTEAQPRPVIDELVADPFAFRLPPQAPDGARTSGKWLLGTSGPRAPGFPLYRLDPQSGSWVPHVVNGRQLAIFPEGQLPAWWRRGRGQNPVPWAPEIHIRTDFLTVHYTAPDQNRVLRIGYATATSIEGPWTDHGFLDLNVRARDVAPDFPGAENPILGLIDSHITTVTDAAGCDRTFLLAKVDGNALRWTERDGTPRSAPTPIVAYEVRQQPDGVIRVVGAPRVLMTNLPHHDGLVESPFVIQSDGELYLLYSAGFYGNGKYRTYIARLDLLNGWVGDERLLIATGSRALREMWNGPGHPSLIKVDDGLFELYVHAWREGTDHRTGDDRRTLMLHLTFRDSEMRRSDPYVAEDRF